MAIGYHYYIKIVLLYQKPCTTDDPSLLIDVDIPDGPATTTSAPAPPVPAGVEVYIFINYKVLILNQNNQIKRYRHRVVM